MSGVRLMAAVDRGVEADLVPPSHIRTHNDCICNTNIPDGKRCDEGVIFAYDEC